MQFPKLPVINVIKNLLLNEIWMLTVKNASLNKENQKFFSSEKDVDLLANVHKQLSYIIDVWFIFIFLIECHSGQKLSTIHSGTKFGKSIETSNLF